MLPETASMPEQASLRSVPTEPAAVQITLINTRTVLRLKSWLPEHTTGGKPVVLVGQELPSQVGATLSGPMRVLCVGPGEWLIVSQAIVASSLRERIQSELPKQGLVLVDLTGGLVVLDVRGSVVRELLSKGCGLDFHSRSFPADRCARTRFAQIPLVLECLDEPLRFELYVGRSYFHYLHAWVADAAVEFEDSSRTAT
jgi:sarcosine oxidase subunit gamma